MLHVVFHQHPQKQSDLVHSGFSFASKHYSIQLSMIFHVDCYFFHSQGSGISKNWAELLRRHNGERLKLERDILKEEQAAIAQFVEGEENKRKQTVDSMTDGLVTSLHGDMKAAEVADIMNKYGKNLEATMNKHNDTKQRQADELHRKLAQRRKGREDALREKQVKEVRHQLF